MIEADAVVIGAGPVGLFQVFQLGLLEISAHVIDSLPYVGGQCIELYPDKPIYDIPAVVACTGRELVAQLEKQAAPFQPTYHLGQSVRELKREADGRFALETTRGQRFLAKAVLIAAGVGAFEPRKLKVDGIETLEGRHLHYHAAPAAALVGQDVWVMGGDESAVQAVLDLAALDYGQRPHSITLLHRREVLQAPTMMVAELLALREAGQLNFKVGQITGFAQNADQSLSGLNIIDVDGATSLHPAQQLIVYLGLSPKLGPVADWGLAMERKQLQVDTEAFATSAPGIFAVGDINTYPGKKKLIVCGFHECVLAAFGTAAMVFPERKTLLQYTTTSPRLHQLLGVATPSKAE
ncbi:NAD(P)/FAD-dependent oxidoreductase [Variovorax sp. HJSM1_2]